MLDEDGLEFDLQEQRQEEDLDFSEHDSMITEKIPLIDFLPGKSEISLGPGTDIDTKVQLM
jgi:hypothetical protein